MCEARKLVYLVTSYHSSNELTRKRVSGQYDKAESFDANNLKTTPACATVFCSDGVSPSGKATGSGPVMRGFESLHPSQKEFSAFFVTMRQLAPKVRLAHCR